jgi:hypothetical protein
MESSVAAQYQSALGDFSVPNQQVAYLGAADNVSRLLPCRLRRIHQPVVRSCIRFSAPRSRLLACL